MNQNQRETLVTCLTRIFGRVEEGLVEEAIPLLRRIELPGGATLMKEGDPPDGVYFVISGRLRASAIQNGLLVPIGEIAPGETVGEMGVLTDTPRPATVVAIRDTVVAHASPESFDRLLERHPRLAARVAGIAIERRRAAGRPGVRKPTNVCLLAVTDGVNLRAFGEEVSEALGRWGRATVQTRDGIEARFGAGAPDATPEDGDVHDLVSAWLDELEFRNSFVVLVTDGGDGPWTHRCLRNADEILLVARAAAVPLVHPIEARLCEGESAITRARQTLVLLHDPTVATPSNTDVWLDRRPVAAHCHLRRGSPRDLARLARVVSGNAIGLVLAGGGARGFAHLGVYKALEEAGVEIDYVGGTSIGAAMASYVSFDLRADDAIAHARKAFAGNPTGDVNFLPLISLIRGRRLRHTMASAVVDAVGRETDLVDCWRPLFCVASSYSEAREVVLTRGRLDRAVRASVSIPAALPPVPWGGELLIDGGVFNNFPTDVMATMGARRIIGVDLAPKRRARQYDFEEIPGPLAILRDRFRGRGRRRFRVPSLGSVLIGTSILYSESRHEQARRSADLYFNPQLGGIALMDWKGFDRIVEIGYQHAREVLSAMSEEELAPYRDAGVGSRLSGVGSRE